MGEKACTPVPLEKSSRQWREWSQPGGKAQTHYARLFLECVTQPRWTNFDKEGYYENRELEDHTERAGSNSWVAVFVPARVQRGNWGNPEVISSEP